MCSHNFAPEIIAINMSVHVCLSDFPLAYLKNHMSERHEMVSTCTRGRGGPPLTAMQYVIYFRFCE